MSDNMKVFLSEGYGKGRIADMPIPEASGNKVLVKVCYCGICGTDQDLFSSDCSFAENGQVTYPLRPGHEWSGVVEAVGEKVTAFKKGDRVVGENAVACGCCESCIKGDYFGCKHVLNVGTIDPVYDGAFSEYYLIPEYHLYKVPDSLSLKEASLAEPLSVAYGGIKHMNITEDSVVAVIGTGCISMASLVLAKSVGAKKVYMIGRNEKKLEVARVLGAETLNIKECDPVKVVNEATNGKGADFVFECSGADNTFSQSLDLAKKKGTVALIGFYENKEKEVNVDVLVSKALFVIGVMGEFGNMSGVLELLEKYKPDLSPIITHELPFADCMDGFLRKNYRDAIKIAVKINEE